MQRLALAFILGVAAACGGPSDREVATARAAQYTAEPATLFDIALQVAQQDYKIAGSDAATATFETQQVMFNREGTRLTPGAGGVIQYGDRAILLSFVVEVVKTERGHAIVVTPHTYQLLAGSPQPRELAPSDPNLPGFVKGRVDTLAFAIYEAAKPHVAR